MQCELKMRTHNSANKIRWRTTGQTMECVSKENIDEYNHANDGDLSLAKDGTSICLPSFQAYIDVVFVDCFVWMYRFCLGC